MSRRWRSMTLALAVSVVTLAAGGAALAASHPPRDLHAPEHPADDPAVTVTPTEDLVEGQFVNVEWSGFRKNLYVYIRECAPTITADTDCDDYTAVVSDTNGAGSALFEIHTGALTDTLTCDYQTPC